MCVYIYVCVCVWIYICIYVCVYIYFLKRNQDLPHSYTVVFWAGCSSFVFASPPFLDKQGRSLFEFALWNSGNVEWLNEAHFLQIKNGGCRKDLFPGGPHTVLLRFRAPWVRENIYSRLEMAEGCSFPG